jgi:hypothetical protein
MLFDIADGISLIIMWIRSSSNHPSNLLRIVNDVYPVKPSSLQQPVALESWRGRGSFAGCLQLCETDMAVRE